MLPSSAESVKSLLSSFSEIYHRSPTAGIKGLGCCVTQWQSQGMDRTLPSGGKLQPEGDAWGERFLLELRALSGYRVWLK